MVSSLLLLSDLRKINNFALFIIITRWKYVLYLMSKLFSIHAFCINNTETRLPAGTVQEN